MERLYRLPFDTNRYELKIMQGWHGPWSHMQLNPDMDLSFAVDFELPLGSEVKAARAGEVLWRYDQGDWCYRGEDRDIGTNPPLEFGWTNCAVILHEDGTTALYSHLRKGSIVVARKQYVNAGETLAYTGLSGWIGDTPHLHFQVCEDDRVFTSTPFSMEDYTGPLEHNELYLSK